MRSASVLMLIAALASCASPPAQFQRAAATQEDYDRDQRGCRGETNRLIRDLERRQTNGMIDSGARIGSGGSIETDQLASDLRNAARQAFEQCMVRRGWSLKSKDAA